MVKKKVKTKKKQPVKKKQSVKQKQEKRKEEIIKEIPTFKLRTEDDIAMDFAIKVYKKFNKIVKSIVLFGSTTKQSATPSSDIDIMIIIDDASIKWDQKLILWYREELEKIIKESPYRRELHVNTMKLTTWWDDLIRGDPTVTNIIRHGEPLIDAGGFFIPLKQLLAQGKIKPTPEAIYSCLQRAPIHFARSKEAELNAIEGLYWAMVDSSHAVLIAAGISPPSPEHIPMELKTNFVDSKKLKMKYVEWYREINALHKKISHGETTDLKGVEIDLWQARTDDFMRTMAQLVNRLVE